MLRLRWSYAGRRYCISLGYPDSRVNRGVAESKAQSIEGDMVTGNFDETLQKYKPRRQQASNTITVKELLARFIEHKRKTVSVSKYESLQKPVADFFGSRPASSVDGDLADLFRVRLAEWLAPATQRERLIGIRAAWKWGIAKGLVASDPWGGVLALVKVPPQQKPKPFSQDEMRAILEGFRSNRYYHHYADFVEFLLSTGCRIGEAIALQWKHLSDDCSRVWIGESVNRKGVRKSTKTNRARTFQLTPRLQSMLLARRPEKWRGDDSVFPAPSGGMLNDSRFCKRAWQKVLKATGIPYRHPYVCRHTFVSHALASGLNPQTVAEMAGHDSHVLFNHYASEIGRLRVPNIFNDNDDNDDKPLEALVDMCFSVTASDDKLLTT
jgi:integrase